MEMETTVHNYDKLLLYLRQLVNTLGLGDDILFSLQVPALGYEYPHSCLWIFVRQRSTSQLAVFELPHQIRSLLAAVLIMIRDGRLYTRH